MLLLTAGRRMQWLRACRPLLATASHLSALPLARLPPSPPTPRSELPLELQRRVGPLPDGFLAYFASRYPGLLMTCYYFALRWCAQEPVFQVR